MKGLYFFYAAILFALNTQAQIIQPFVVNASGGFIQNSTVNVEWSLGELAVTTIGTPNNLLTQGFLQPLLDSISGVSYHFDEGEIVAFPNPVSSNLFFKTSSSNIATVLVADVLGRVVLETDFTHKIDLHLLVSGAYFIFLVDKEQQLIQSFKIIKI